jgi:HD-GYP domain-containing protein (c-di-GMP phosphodiesterase class II)
MHNLLKRFNIYYEMLDAGGHIEPRNPSFWRYLDIPMPSTPVPVTEVFEELVGREDDIGQIVGSGRKEIHIPGIRRQAYYFDLTILSDSESEFPAFVVIEDSTASMDLRQELMQNKNEVELLKRDLEEQNAELRTANRKLELIEGGLLDRNDELSSLLRLIRTQNHDLEAKVRIRTRELNRSRLAAIMKLALVAEFRDQETGGHIYRVGRSCVMIGKRLGISPADREILFYASLLHDVGKIGIPDRILQKPGPLTPDERQVMKTHTSMGATLLSGDNHALFVTSRDIALCHHEKWDGSGYPNGLEGEAIPLMVRICSVADVFDALTSERPYKEAWDLGRAMNQIETEAGTSFDPTVVASFLSASEDILRLRQGPEDLEYLEPEFY